MNSQTQQRSTPQQNPSTSQNVNDRLEKPKGNRKRDFSKVVGPEFSAQVENSRTIDVNGYLSRQEANITGATNN